MHISCQKNLKIWKRKHELQVFWFHTSFELEREWVPPSLFLSLERQGESKRERGTKAGQLRMKALWGLASSLGHARAPATSPSKLALAAPRHARREQLPSSLDDFSPPLVLWIWRRNNKACTRSQSLKAPWGSASTLDHVRASVTRRTKPAPAAPRRARRRPQQQWS
jgi:hypothetical protein